MRRAARVAVAGSLLFVPAATAEPPADARKTTGEAMEAFLGRMLGDPALREVTRVHQHALRGRIYAPLYRELGLTDDVQQKLAELLLARDAAGLDRVASFLSDGKLPPVGGTEASRDERERIDAQIRALLGAERFPRYEAYEETIPARIRLDLFQTLLAGGEQALQDWQMEALVRALREEEKSPPAGLLAGGSGEMRSPEDLGSLLDEQKLASIVAWREASNQRILERARQILSAEQWKAFDEFQKHEILTLRLGMKAYQQLFDGQAEGAGGAGTPEVPPAR